MSHPRRVFLLAFAAFFLMAAAWAVALPVNGTYDEKQHIVRAYAVVTGQWLPSEKATEATGFGTEAFRAPASLLPGDVDCTWFQGRRPAAGETPGGGPPGRPRPASCQQPAGGPERIVLPTAAARYSPAYYLPVGLPLLVSPDRTGILLARLVSGALSALLLAAAAMIAARLRNRLLLAGLALVATPMAMNLGGSVNPNGIEISAGVLLFVSLFALLRGQPTALLTGASALIMLTVRQLGPVLLAVNVVACLALAGRGEVAALWRDRAARRILGGFAAVGVVFTAFWTLVSPADVAPAPARALSLGTGELWREIATFRIPFYLRQVVGQFGYGETTISPYAILLWYLLCLAVVVPALVWGGRRLRLVLAGLALFCGIGLVALDVYFVSRSGWFAHGRYALPTAAGIVLLAATAWAGRRFPRWFPVALAAATVPVHLYALARVMTRYQVGIDAGLNPFGGSWQPPGGPAVPVAVEVVGLALLIAVVAFGVITTSSRVTTPEPADPQPVAPIGQTAGGVTKHSTTDTPAH